MCVSHLFTHICTLTPPVHNVCVNPASAAQRIKRQRLKFETSQRLKLENPPNPNQPPPPPSPKPSTPPPPPYTENEMAPYILNLHTCRRLTEELTAGIAFCKAVEKSVADCCEYMVKKGGVSAGIVEGAEVAVKAGEEVKGKGVLGEAKAKDPQIG